MREWNPSHDTRFKPGNPGGPGRPKGKTSIVDELRRRIDSTDEDGVTYARKVAELAVKLALTGDFKFIEFVTNKTEASLLAEAVGELREMINAERSGDAAGSPGDAGRAG